MENKKEPLKIKADLEGAHLLDEMSGDERAIGVFYAPSGGNVHFIAKRIKQLLRERPVELHCLTQASPKLMLAYRNIIFVSSSLGNDNWDGDSQDKWASFLPKMRKISLKGKNIALVGLGDSVKYPNNFVDSLKLMADAVRECGGHLVGKTEPDGYTFLASKAIEDGLFLGLPLDQDNEADKSDVRIKEWLSLLEFANE